MNSLNLKVRTRLSLMNILINENTPAWVIAREKFNLINKIEVHNFEGSIKIQGDFDNQRSYFREDGRLVVYFTNGKIVKTNERWNGQNPVQYFTIEEEITMEEIEDLFE